MTLLSFIQFLKYKWKAKGRHGTHSPFVYDFIERVLLNKELIDRAFIIEIPELALRYENIVSRTATHYNYKSVLKLPLENESLIPDHADLLFFSATAPYQWIEWMNSYFSILNEEGAIIVSGIHKTPHHTLQWRNLCNDTKVNMSIDLYGIGILFFRQSFKEKQHFILSC